MAQNFPAPRQVASHVQAGSGGSGWRGVTVSRAWLQPDRQRVSGAMLSCTWSVPAEFAKLDQRRGKLQLPLVGRSAVEWEFQEELPILRYLKWKHGTALALRAMATGFPCDYWLHLEPRSHHQLYKYTSICLLWVMTLVWVSHNQESI